MTYCVYSTRQVRSPEKSLFARPELPPAMLNCGTNPDLCSFFSSSSGFSFRIPASTLSHHALTDRSAWRMSYVCALCDSVRTCGTLVKVLCPFQSLRALCQYLRGGTNSCQGRIQGPPKGSCSLVQGPWLGAVRLCKRCCLRLLLPNLLKDRVGRNGLRACGKKHCTSKQSIHECSTVLAPITCLLCLPL